MRAKYEEELDAHYSANPEIGRYKLAELTGIPPATCQRFLKRKKGGVRKAKGESVVHFHDAHIPYHDAAAVRATQAFCEHTQPEIIVFHEMHDFYDLSNFDKNPARTHTLQDELDMTFEELRKIRKACPNSRMIMLESNHTDRLRRYLWKQSPGLSSLRALNIVELMRLPEIKAEYLETFEHRGFLFKHGDVVRKDAAYTAKAELEREGMSGASGHTHRLGKYYRTLRGGEYVWIEGGCLCDLNPEYVKGIPNWQHGMVHVQFENNGNQFYAQDIPIIKGKILYGGEIIG